ncbi:hypothetical protein H5410_036041 [Solanum commersonii]|uniref:Uncharacterized protein n=1 Tax=Solanum commersonii TaxID=4109 RepID=A0A9J5Y306_SOLCO|nr:hypothetical protein H5410_036041 [Solanum commersonii]
MMQHMDNPHHYNQFQRILDKDIVGESSGNKLSNSTSMGDTTDDVVPVIPPVNTNSTVVEPPVNNSSQRDVRHFTRPRKLPSWMNDFITNATSTSTPYPLSHTFRGIQRTWSKDRRLIDGSRLKFGFEWWCSSVASVRKWNFAKMVHLYDGVKVIHGIYDLVLVQDAMFAFIVLGVPLVGVGHWSWAHWSLVIRRIVVLWNGTFSFKRVVLVFSDESGALRQAWFCWEGVGAQKRIGGVFRVLK